MNQGVFTHSRNYQDICHLCTGFDPEPIPSPSGSFPVDRFGDPGLVDGSRPRGLADRGHEQRNQPSNHRSGLYCWTDSGDEQAHGKVRAHDQTCGELLPSFKGCAGRGSCHAYPDRTFAHARRGPFLRSHGGGIPP